MVLGTWIALLGAYPSSASSPPPSANSQGAARRSAEGSFRTSGSAATRSVVARNGRGEKRRPRSRPMLRWSVRFGMGRPSAPAETAQQRRTNSSLTAGSATGSGAEDRTAARRRPRRRPCLVAEAEVRQSPGQWGANAVSVPQGLRQGGLSAGRPAAAVANAEDLG